jgi:hypothetical protein
MLVGVVAAQPPTALEELQAENERLKVAVRELTEKLSAARSETEFLQQRAEETQLRLAAMLGGQSNETATVRLQQQFTDTVRALHLADVERQRLAKQLQQLVAAIGQNRDVPGEMARAKALLDDGRLAAAGGGTLLAAQVVDVNQRLQMVVLNAGRQQGVRVGMPFVVLRGDRVVARVKVLEVRPRMCGALVEQVDNGIKLQVGDHVQVTKS